MGEGKSGWKLRVHRSVVGALVILVLLIGAIKFSGPFSASRRQGEELARLRREKAALAAEHKDLSHYKRLLASDQGLESAARREGYLRSGDRRIIFVPEKGSGAGGQGPERPGTGDRPAQRPAGKSRKSK